MNLRYLGLVPVSKCSVRFPGEAIFLLVRPLSQVENVDRCIMLASVAEQAASRLTWSHNSKESSHDVACIEKENGSLYVTSNNVVTSTGSPIKIAQLT